MRVIGLDLKEYPWNPGGNQHLQSKASALHTKAKELLKKLFPFDRILEEVSLPGSKTKGHGQLTADFFIPNRNLMIEVNGEQHYAQNSHFHDNAHDFYKGVARDRDKAQWCELNDFRLVILAYNGTLEEWEDIING